MKYDEAPDNRLSSCDRERAPHIDYPSRLSIEDDEPKRSIILAIAEQAPMPSIANEDNERGGEVRRNSSGDPLDSRKEGEPFRAYYYLL